jgi:hypothetical protein
MEMEIIKTLPWRTAILASIGYLLTPLLLQLSGHGVPSILSLFLSVAMGPVLALNIKLASGKAASIQVTIFGGVAIFGMMLHVLFYGATLMSGEWANEVGIGLAIGGLLLVVAAWVAQQTVQGIYRILKTITGWVSQDWK